MKLHRSPCLRALLVSSAVALGAAGCARPSTSARSPGDVSLIAADGSHLNTAGLLGSADWGVLVFISRDCPCLAAHDARLRDLPRPSHHEA